MKAEVHDRRSVAGVACPRDALQLRVPANEVRADGQQQRDGRQPAGEAASARERQRGRPGWNPEGRARIFVQDLSLSRRLREPRSPCLRRTVRREAFAALARAAGRDQERPFLTGNSWATELDRSASWLEAHAAQAQFLPNGPLQGLIPDSHGLTSL